MSEHHSEIFSPPPDLDIKIWRYMDFTKLVSLLENRGLFFCRLDCLGDPFEGSFTRVNEKLWQQYWTQTGQPLTKTPLRSLLHCEPKFRAWVKDYRQRVFVNCWHMGRQESLAMWKLYSRTEEAVCIQSTFLRLRECLSGNIQTGIVRYIDYDQDSIPGGNAYWAFMHKRKSFEHEQEVRAVHFPESDVQVASKSLQGSLPKGVWQQVDLDGLIERVFVAPSAPAWFAELTKQMLTRYELRKEVQHSALDADPFW